MNYHPRILEAVLAKRLEQFPVVAVTGPRQSGKTTLVRQKLANWQYVTLEDFDVRSSAEEDPRGFLQEWGEGTIIDEFQRAPRLVSYLQSAVDSTGKPGQYVLTGSQSYVLHEQLSQSLAGRVGLLTLYPFAAQEQPPDDAEASAWPTVHTGGFPRVSLGEVPPEVWFPSYVTTYIERDVRQMLAVRDLIAFQAFVKTLALRAGQLLNYSSLARDCGVSVPTVRDWLSVLEAGHVVFRLAPWPSSERKRLVKTPKVYFVDTGLLCSVLGIRSAAELTRHSLRGSIFENWAVMEAVKTAANLGEMPGLHFWRDTEGHEVDLLATVRGRTVAIEVKSGETASPGMLKGLHYLATRTELAAPSMLLYAGRLAHSFRHGKAIPWRLFGATLEHAWKIPEQSPA